LADSNPPPGLSMTAARHFKLLVLLVVVLALNLGVTWLTHQINFQLFPRHEPILHSLVVGAAVLYVILMAIPFVPGVEIGLGLMVLLGSKGALLVYLCTVTALCISFQVGRRIPSRALCPLLDWLHRHRASALARRLEPLSPPARLQHLNAKLPSRIAPFLLKHRYLALAAALNVPGNALIGGGGGISVIVSMSKLIPFHAFVVVVAVAVAPVPFMFYLQGL
jgi:hypothetical protein